jgi:hypothetical protein
MPQYGTARIISLWITAAAISAARSVFTRAMKICSSRDGRDCAVATSRESPVSEAHMAIGADALLKYLSDQPDIHPPGMLADAPRLGSLS